MATPSGPEKGKVMWLWSLAASAANLAVPSQATPVFVRTERRQGQGVIVQGVNECVVLAPAHLLSIKETTAAVVGQAGEKRLATVIYRDDKLDFLLLQMLPPWSQPCMPIEHNLTDEAFMYAPYLFAVTRGENGELVRHELQPIRTDDRELYVKPSAEMVRGVSGAPIFLDGRVIAIIISGEGKQSESGVVVALRSDFIGKVAGQRLPEPRRYVAAAGADLASQAADDDAYLGDPPLPGGRTPNVDRDAIASENQSEKETSRAATSLAGTEESVEPELGDEPIDYNLRRASGLTNTANKNTENESSASQEEDQTKETVDSASKPTLLDTGIELPTYDLDGTLSWPVREPISKSLFVPASEAGYEGLILNTDIDTAVLSCDDGIVLDVQEGVNIYGKAVVIRHKNNMISLYGFLNSISVRKGQKVKRGQRVALSGKTGNAVSPSLFFQVRIGSTTVDPLPLLKRIRFEF